MAASGPEADKYPGWSPYNYCVNNPLKLVDPNGKWPWVANQINSNPTYSGIKSLINGETYSYVNLSSAERQSINHNQFERATLYINSKSEKLGKFLIETQVPIALANGMRDASGKTSLSEVGAIIDNQFLNDNTIFSMILGHEAVPMMGGSEFSAFGVGIASGLLGMSGFKEMINENLDKLDYFTEGIPDSKKKEEVKSLLEDMIDGKDVTDEIKGIYKSEGEQWLKNH